MASAPRVVVRDPRPPLQPRSEPTETEVARSVGQRGVLRRLWHDPTARAGMLIVAGLGLVAAFAPHLAPHDPMEFVTDRLAPPSWDHPFGADRLGRDVLSRTIHGARVSLGTALIAATTITLLGIFFGAVAGYFGGLIDSVIMRVVDVILAFPNLILALVIAGLFEPGITTLLFALASVWWVSYARIIRGLVLSVREWPFVEAAQALGASEPRIIVRHILPNILPPVIVLATLEMGMLILALAGLNFLGLGVQPPTAEWGAMVNEGRAHFFSAPHLILVPGFTIGLAVLGFNLLGDGLRDVLDPRLRSAKR